MLNSLSSYSIAAFLLLGMSLGSCSSDAPSESDASLEDEMEVSETQSSMDDIPEDNGFIIPSAFHLSSLFQKSGLAFSDGLVNSPENVNQYGTRMSKLLNFGVYSADLFYCVLNDQNQSSRKYLKAMKQLSEEAGMGEIFNTKTILENFEANIDNQDSVLKYVLQIQEQTEDYIEKTNEEHTAMVIFTGAWIEGMYVSLESYSAGQNEELGKRIVEQTYMLDNIIKGLELHPGDPEELQNLATELKELHKSVSASEDYPKDQYEFHEHTLRPEEIMSFKNALSSIRTKLTKNQAE